MQKIIIPLSALLIFHGTWISFAFGQTNPAKLKIQQEKYTYKMPVTQAVTAETFVIIEGSKTDKETYSKKDKILDCNKADKSSGENAVKSAVLATCLFQFDSPVLMPSEADKILAALAEKKLKNIPLAVTGYTCSLGPDEHNQTLSLQRAETVADLLRRHGFTVATVQGKGSQNPVTNDPRLFRLNRRVTVRVKNKK